VKVLAVRSSDGDLRAFRNVCRHRGARLVPEGVGTCGSVIQCPYHQWVYADTGELRRAPWFGEDPMFDTADWPLMPLRVEVWRGLVFVAVDPLESLAEQLGELIAELADEPLETYSLHREERMVFDANWKIYVDNFIEGYHIPGIHPDFFRAIEFDKFETTARDGYVHMTAPPRDGLIYRGTWLWMWPNWTLSLFADGFNTSRINPLDVNRTELVYHYYFADSVPVEERERTVAGSIEIVRQDFEVCLHTNRNYRSRGYTPGPLSPLHEQGVAYFQQRLVDARRL
jgi:choline monooxygenase